MKVDYEKVSDVVNYYIYMKDHPDWDGLAKALRKLQLSDVETQYILISARKGGW